ncbi:MULTISPECIES: flagellar brake protein [unclassified Massilia]|uniref:flagellar brake protein n=1 Tax=unclassified Massilia TaxID=2609279 RepID=UPI001B80EC39|nr:MULTISPECIES: flagellar brake protein [unclassified Massilia]MBQ5938956.1 flagellar brake protein [Massilia sp. AB1]MBQ5962493.1 flagellar brake protein [Massilia sp. ZL223]
MTGAATQELKSQEFQFETLNLQVGVRLQVVTHRSVKPISHFSTLIGYVKDEYIIVKIPIENGTPIGLIEGERVTVRVFSGVNVCSFACTVERVFGRPLLYVHLSFPTSIQGTSLRGAMRVKTELPARVRSTTQPAAAPIDCTLTNVSVTGARVDSPLPFPHGEEVVGMQFTIAIPAANQETRIDTMAIVRNVTIDKSAASRGEIYSYGVQFLDLDPVHFTMLQNMTYEALLADRMKIV